MFSPPPVHPSSFLVIDLDNGTVQSCQYLDECEKELYDSDFLVIDHSNNRYCNGSPVWDAIERYEVADESEAEE